MYLVIYMYVGYGILTLDLLILLILYDGKSDEMSKVLIVVDMQNDFIDGSLGTPEAVGIVQNVLDKIKEYEWNNDKIIFTKDTHFNNYLDTEEGKKLPVEHCIKGTKGWEIASDLEPYVTEVCEKNTFGSVSLVEILKGESYEGIELVGLCTDICVISNALMLKAYFPETPITVNASCCAGVNVQSHTNALESMKMCQINIINE